MSLLDVSVTEFLDRLASKEPVPGGGSVAGLTGSMAAGLIAMVCSLTMGKKKFVSVEGDIRELFDQAQALRQELQDLTDADVSAFQELSSAYKLGHDTPEDTASRHEAIQKATRKATDVPLGIAQAAAQVLPLCMPTAEKGNPAAVSDVGVAVLLTKAAVRSALLNVEINLNVLEDEQYVRETRAVVEGLTANLDADAEAVMNVVHAKM